MNPLGVSNWDATKHEGNAIHSVFKGYMWLTVSGPVAYWLGMLVAVYLLVPSHVISDRRYTLNL